MIQETAISRFAVVEARDQMTGLWRELNGQLIGASVDRGSSSTGASETLRVGTSNLTLFGDVDLGIDTVVRPNSAIRIRHRETGSVAYTGTIIDATQSFSWSDDKSERFTHTYVSTADAVQALGNTPRYGAVAPGGAGRQSWGERIAQLNESATVDIGQVRDNEKVLYDLYANMSKPGWPPANDGWLEQVPNLAPGYGLNMFDFSNVDGQQGLYSMIINRSDNPYNAPAKAVANGQYGIKRTFTGLTVGKAYRFYMDMAVYVKAGFMPTDVEDAHWWRSQVDGKAWSPEIRINSTGAYGTYPDAMAPLQFVATATTHVIRITNSRAFSLAAGGTTNSGVTAYFQNARLTEMTVTDDYVLQDVVYESNLLNHYQLACDSVGARFWVDAENRVQFRRQAEDTAIVATFSDTDAPYGQTGWGETRRNLIADPTATATNWVAMSAGEVGKAGGWVTLTADIARTFLRMRIPMPAEARPVQPGDRFIFRVLVLGHPTIPLYVRSTVAGIAGAVTLVPAGGQVTLQQFGAVSGATVASPEVMVYADAAGTGSIAAGGYLRFNQGLFDVRAGLPTSGTIPFFAGFTPSTDAIRYSWSGAEYGSESVRQEPTFGFLPETGYTELDVSFDTRNVVNALTLNQHGRKLDNGEYRADDYAVTKHDPISVATWGEREASIDTCLWLGAGHQLDADQRADEVFELRANPFYTIQHIRFNAQSNTTLAFTLDVYSRIRIKFDGFTQVSRVARIKHSLSGTRWMVDLYLTDSTFGPTFDEFSDYYAGKTFDQLSDLLDGQTFDQLAKRTLQ